jgi:hypothetical protein
MQKLNITVPNNKAGRQNIKKQSSKGAQEYANNLFAHFLATCIVCFHIHIKFSKLVILFMF